MVLPGRVPGYKRSDIQLLPSSTTKHKVWELYQQAAATGSTRPVCYSIFTSLWRQLLPQVVVMKPMSDLCWLCQQNSIAITRSANRPEEEKTLVHNIVVTTSIGTYINQKDHAMYNDESENRKRREKRGREHGETECRIRTEREGKRAQRV